MRRHAAQRAHLLASFRGLEGGSYGTIDLRALSADRLEMTLGADFVYLTRAQAEALAGALGTFIARTTTAEARRPAVQEVVERVDEREDVVAVEEKPIRRRRTRRAPSQAQ